MIRFGKAKTVSRRQRCPRSSTYGALVQRSHVAAKQAEQQGISVEIIDLRTLNPYDWNAIAESAKKLHGVIVRSRRPQCRGLRRRARPRASRTSCSSISTLRPPRRRAGYVRGLRAAIGRRDPAAVADVLKAIVELKG